ncbi:MAG: nucleoside deaminase [Candidatus Pacebacteria bacterium]|nr:nucleoside deaminase [Candidatus Paceibacterota bacterium]
MENNNFLRWAIEKARESVAQGGFPAGAVVVKDGKVIGEGISIGNKLNDPTSHGEMAAIRDACKNLNTTNLSGAIMYASMQPCLMCLGASVWSSISKIIYACPKNKLVAEYYGGHYVPEALNTELTRPIEMIPVPELEEISLKVVREWENSL